MINSDEHLTPAVTVDGSVIAKRVGPSVKSDSSREASLFE